MTLDTRHHPLDGQIDRLCCMHLADKFVFFFETIELNDLSSSSCSSSLVSITSVFGHRTLKARIGQHTHTYCTKKLSTEKM